FAAVARGCYGILRRAALDNQRINTMPRIYTAGTLLWVDDDFPNNPLDTEGGEISVWRKTFGNTDNRIYRLLSIQLQVATSRKEAFGVIDDLAQVEHQHRFVQAVVDLRIPDQPSG